MDEEVSFSANGSLDPDGALVGYYWDIDDVVHATGREAVHTFTWPGPHRVSLTVEDRLGATATAKITVQVYRGGPPPSPSFVMNDWNVTLGEGIYFDGGASFDDIGWIENATWTFGDGKTAKGLQVWHNYTKPGRYEVTLTVTNDRGSVNSTSTFVEVHGRPLTAPVVLLVVLVIGAGLLAAAAWPRRPEQG
jgi:PKD repeat protein